MLSMTEIKIKEEVKAMERELLEVGRMIVEEEAIRREKIAGCNAAREMHEAQVSAILIVTGIVLTYHIQVQGYAIHATPSAMKVNWSKV